MLLAEDVSSLAKRWDPSEPGVAELLKQGVYLPLPGYDDQVKTEKSIFFLLQISKPYSIPSLSLLAISNFHFRDVLLSFAPLAR